MPFSKCALLLGFLSFFGLAGLGFAQTNALPRISAMEATNYLNQRVVVVDKVAQVAIRSNIWLLHLNQKFPKSPLNATVRKSATNNFPNFADYFGQRVEITGQIIDYRGRLEIALLTTNQIKVLAEEQSNPVPAPVVAEAQSKPAPVPSATVAVSPAVAPVLEPKANSDDQSGRALNWILGLLAVICLLLAVGIFIMWRRPANSKVVVQPAGPLIKASNGSEVTVASSSAEDWKQRALAAEAMAGKQGEILREKMIPELTEFAKQSLVQGLYAQRNVLLETQQKAQLALTELEARLNTIQAPLHERIRTYEKRIAELENEVETQGDEVRELTRATLTLVRKKLEDERQSGQLQTRFN